MGEHVRILREMIDKMQLCNCSNEKALRDLSFELEHAVSEIVSSIVMMELKLRAKA